MAHEFKVRDHVGWNSEAGLVRGTIKKKITTEIQFKGYTVHASEEEPRLSDILYVEMLIGSDTINTLPLATINAYRDHGHPRATIEKDLAGAQQTLQNLAEVGLSLDAITQQVLDEGGEKLNVALDKPWQSIEAKRNARIGAQVIRGRAEVANGLDAARS